MLGKQRRIVKIICGILRDNFKLSRPRSDRRRGNGIFQRRENVFQEASTCLELRCLWDSLCGELRRPLKALRKVL